MSDSQYILVERNERIGIVTLNRPKEFNALNFQLVDELINALEELDRDSDIRCLIITSTGEKAFAAGADIKEMAERPSDEIITSFERWHSIKTITKPLIAAVGGYALGGGCELAMMCDIIIASENARFGLPEILLGVIPSAGGTQRLTRTIGKYRTMEMILTGQQVTAQEMAAHGLVNRVVPKGEHLTEALKRARQIAELAPIAVRAAKQAVQAALETSLEEGLNVEHQNVATVFNTEDMREGMQAFIEKRKPDFKGK
jgi:enoyl-CoA hydratase